MNKSHKNAIMFHKNRLESEFNFKCRREFNLPVDGQIHNIDLACFRRHPKINAVGMEFESNPNFNNPQIKSNAEDLKEFRRLFPKSRTWHLQPKQNADFSELNESPKPIPRFQRRRFR